MKITVIGSGGWGTALALVLYENGHHVTLWSHRPEKAEELKQTRENPMLKGVPLPQGLNLTADLAAAGESEVVVMVTPSYAVRETAAKLRGIVKPGTVIVSASKGIERGSSLRLSQVIDQELGGTCPVVVLSGPSHAEEVGRHIPTGVVAAAERLEHAELVQDLFMNPRFRVYTSNDPIGTEICAALKNVIALCAGCTDGMGCGDNTKALLDLHRPGRGGRPDCHLLFHALPEPPVRHSHRSGQAGPAGAGRDRRGGGGLLRRRQRPDAGSEGRRGNAHRPGRLRGAL